LGRERLVRSWRRPPASGPRRGRVWAEIITAKAGISPIA
jgi:hypothetical protein